MRRRVCLSLGWVTLTMTSLGVAVEQQFKFPMLPGFKPLSDVTPVEGVIDEAILEDSRKADVYGVIMEAGEVVATFTAIERDGAAPLLHTFASVEQMIKLTPGLEGAKAVSIKTPKLSGVLCSRVELEVITPDRAWRQLAYVVPGDKRWASLLLGATPDRYEPLAKQLDDLVEKLPGIAETDASVQQESASETLGSLGMTALGAAGFGVAVRALYRRSVAKEKAKKTGSV
jgi:hypothetical protein